MFRPLQRIARPSAAFLKASTQAQGVHARYFSAAATMPGWIVKKKEEKVLVDGREGVKKFTLPGYEGPMEVVPGEEPCLKRFGPGKVTVELANGTVKHYYAEAGYAVVYEDASCRVYIDPEPLMELWKKVTTQIESAKQTLESNPTTPTERVSKIFAEGNKKFYETFLDRYLNVFDTNAARFRDYSEKLEKELKEKEKELNPILFGELEIEYLTSKAFAELYSTPRKVQEASS